MPAAPKYALLAMVLACYAYRSNGFTTLLGAGSGRTRAALGAARTYSGAPMRRSQGVLKMSTEQEKEQEKATQATDAGTSDGKVMENDKLVYDRRTGRFYEKQIEEVCREEYCAIDESTGKPMLLTTGEKERIFMDSIQSFYYNQRQLLTDDDFDKLKEDLSWEGSQVILMNRDEQLFMNAMAAYGRGEQIISDEEFDKLKASLKASGSAVAVSKEPKCYIDTGICTVTYQEDLFRRFATYLPANFIFGLALLGIAWEVIYPLRSLNPLANLLILSGPTIFLSKQFTDLCLYQDNGTVASGPCPSCNASNRVFFGSILGVQGDVDDADFKCASCGELIKIRRSDLRARTVPKI
ncbi:unnamed protein product [Ascophyllum nodosum]